MKPFFIMAIACCFSLACSKNRVVNNSLITGNWELREEIGGIAGIIRYEHGEGPVYYFDNNNHFRSAYRNTATGNGTYQLQASNHPGHFILLLRYASGTQPNVQRDSVQLDKNQLIFLPAQSCCDIPASVFQRFPF